jgi:hypothetical protein
VLEREQISTIAAVFHTVTIDPDHDSAPRCLGRVAIRLLLNAEELTDAQLNMSKSPSDSCNRARVQHATPLRELVHLTATTGQPAHTRGVRDSPPAWISPDRPDNPVRVALNTTCGGQKNAERSPAVTLSGLACLLSETSFGNLTGRHHKHNRKPCVVAPSGRIAVPIVRIEFRGVFSRLFRPAVVFHEEAEPRPSTSVAAVAVRPKSTPGACSRAAPLVEHIVTPADIHPPRCTYEGHENCVCAQRMSEVAHKTPVVAFAQQPMMSGGNGR